MLPAVAALHATLLPMLTLAQRFDPACKGRGVASMRSSCPVSSRKPSGIEPMPHILTCATADSRWFDPVDPRGLLDGVLSAAAGPGKCFGMFVRGNDLCVVQRHGILTYRML